MTDPEYSEDESFREQHTGLYISTGSKHLGRDPSLDPVVPNFTPDPVPFLIPGTTS